jgi:hypothetical protein
MCREFIVCARRFQFTLASHRPQALGDGEIVRAIGQGKFDHAHQIGVNAV